MQFPLPQSTRQVILVAIFCLLATACQREVSPPLPPSARGDGTVPGAMLQLPDFTTLVEKQGVAVVNVSTTPATALAAGRIPGVPEDHPLYDFFRRLPAPPEDEEPSNSLGSGFILSEEGHILTNAHVVDDAVEVTVRLTDKREFKAKVVGSDRRTDIALLKIEATGLPTVRIGNPATLKVGEWVVAIGSPFGFDSSVTAGIVSAIGRALPDESLVPFIQTDVAINPGNSGGPLFNLKGEVVGINSQIYSRTGGYMGLSFAIPIDLAIRVSDELRARGRVIRGRLGVQIQDLNPELAASFGLATPSGALVAGVEKGSPAATAGIQTGDVIVEFDGKPIKDSGELPPLVAATKPGTSLSVKLMRKGQGKELRVDIGELADDRPAESSRDKTVPPNRLGLVLSELDEAERRELNVDTGLFVENAVGPAAKAGIRDGDVIIAINDVEVARLAEFNKLLAKQPQEKAIALLVRRGTRSLYVPVKPE
jgi:serine protease Do